MVERPRVHVGVETEVGHRTKEESFAGLPGCASSNPTFGSGFEGSIGRLSFESINLGFQVKGSTFQVSIGGEHHVVYVDRNDTSKFGFVGGSVALGDEGLHLLVEEFVEGSAGVLSGLGFLAADVVAERLRNVLDGLGSCGNGLVYLSGEGSVLAVDEAEERRSGLGVFVVDARAVAIEGVADGVDVVGVVVIIRTNSKFSSAISPKKFQP